jgi:hypothetical protein
VLTSFQCKRERVEAIFRKIVTFLGATYSGARSRHSMTIGLYLLLMIDQTLSNFGRIA